MQGTIVCQIPEGLNHAEFTQALSTFMAQYTPIHSAGAAPQGDEGSQEQDQGHPSVGPDYDGEMEEEGDKMGSYSVEKPSP